MEWRKTIIFLMIAIFLFSIAAVSASDVDDMEIASEDANQIELSASNEMNVDNLKTSEENTIETQAKNNKSMSAALGSKLLATDTGTYSGLSREIGSGGNIELQHDYYTYDSGNTIKITLDNTVIDGKGAIIDMDRSTNIQPFYVTASGVTFKNLTIKNANYDGYGCAIYFSSSATSGTVTNCNFTNNTATYEGGAVWIYSGTVTNCNFTNNTATYNGGAVWTYSGTVTNCNFTNNTAGNGGAVWTYSGSVENCNFTDNKATGDGGYGGAVYFQSTGEMTNCNFTNNTASVGGGAVRMSSGSVENCNFTNNTATRDGGAVYFLDQGSVENCNFTNNSARYGGAVYFSSNGEVTNCNFTNNTATDNGGAVRMSSGSVENCNFTNNTATKDGGAVYFSSNGEVTNCNFTNNTATKDGGAVWMSSGSVENCNFTNNKATGDSSYGGAVCFQNTGEVTNCNFTNNTATYEGGAVCFQSTGEVTNCNFTNNNATRDGGAVWMSSGNVEKCNFTNNSARFGGAIDFEETSNVTNCNFTNNTAEYGGAIRFGSTGTVTNCNFTNNKATNNGGAVWIYSGNVTNCNFTNNKATGDYHYGGAVYFSSTGNVTNCNFVKNSAYLGGAIGSKGEYTAADTCIFKRNSGENFNVVIYPPTLDVDDFTTFYGSGKKLTFDLKTNISNVPVTNGNISISVYFKDNETWVVDSSCLSGEGWIPDLPVGSYIAAFDTEYAGFQPINRTVTITIPDVQYYINVTSDTRNNKTVNFTAKSDIPKDILWDGKLLFILPNGTEINANYEDDNTWWAVHTFDEYGEYNITASYAGLNNVLVNKGTITINKEDSTIKLDNIVLDYGDSKNVTVTTTGATAITAKIDGTDIAVINDYTIPISALAAGNHTLTVTTIADEDHNPVTKEVNITVNKLSTEITVNNETLDLKANDEFAVIANLNPAGAGKPTYSSSNESLVKVSDEGLIKALSEGSATVTVSFEGNENYTAAQNKTISVTVTLNDASVSAEDIELNVGANATIAATTSPEGLDVTYVPDNSGVITVDEKGVVTAVKEGAATVTLTVGGDGVYVKNSTTITVTVKKIDTSIDIDANTLDLEVGDNTIISATLTPADAGNLTYESSNSSVVTVDDEGNIKAVGAGNAEITVSYSGDDKYNAAESKTVTVTVSLKDASISAKDIELNVSDTATISPVTSPEGLEVTYVPDNSGVITVDEKGVVTALKEGTSTIILSVGGDGIYAENSTTITVTVKKIDTSIDIDANTLDLEVGDNSSISATLTPADAGNLTYESSNSSVVTVDDEGNIKAVGAGNAEITVSYSGDDKYNAAESKTVTVTVSLKDASISAKDIELNVSDTATISPVTSPEGLEVTYVPDNSGVITVDEKGVVTALKEGTATITLTVGGDEVYTENSTTITVTVNKINTPINVYIPENITVGDNSTVNVVLPEDAKGNVTVKVDGEIVDTVAVKDGNADVTIPSLSAGDHTVEIAYSGDDKYEAASRTATITVAKDSTNISASDVTATYKVNKYLVITLKDSHGNPLANSTVTVDLNGAKDYVSDENGQVKVKVSNLVPKTYTAKIRFEGSDNYLGSDATAKVVVKKANPKITASNKMFKTTTKTKKYTITLKDNTGKAIKNAKVYLKVNGKTYTAKTNSKGQATFKITKLNKKGTFKATISYKGSKYFNKISKKVNLKVISSWKTISKGSKAKSTVKEIQRALKNHGYYLTAYGHYLKIDGIYWDHTVKAVKQFQKAKKLKVTGKVDEKTAKKLGII